MTFNNMAGTEYEAWNRDYCLRIENRNLWFMKRKRVGAVAQNDANQFVAAMVKSKSNVMDLY